MDHPCDHINDAVLPAVPLEEPVREEASTSTSPGIQAPSLPQDTPAFQMPSHSQHKDNLPQLTRRELTAEQKEEHMRIYTYFKSQENQVNEVPSHSQHEDYLPQLTAEQKEELMRIHTEITSQENPVNQVTSFEFEEPRDETAIYHAIFKEPQDRANVNINAISEEPQGESDDSKSVSEEGSGQEEWTPQGKRKQGKPKSNVKRKYTKRNSAKTQDSEASRS